MKTVLFVIVLTLANIIQGITGFAGAPIAMPPCIALMGISDAKSSITFVFWITSLVVTVKNIKDIDFKHLGIILGFMSVGVIGGMWMFSHLPLNILMLIYGIVVVGIGVKKLFIKKTIKLPKPVAFVVLFLAGLMQGLFTSGGPFLALYSAEEIKDKKVFRPTVTTVWTVLNTYMVISMYVKGMYTPTSWKLVLFSVVPVFGAIYLGKYLNKKMKQETFLKLVYVLLILSGSLLIYNYFTSGIKA